MNGYQKSVFMQNYERQHKEEQLTAEETDFLSVAFIIGMSVLGCMAFIGFILILHLLGALFF